MGFIVELLYNSQYEPREMDTPRIFMNIISQLVSRNHKMTSEFGCVDEYAKGVNYSQLNAAFPVLKFVDKIA